MSKIFTVEVDGIVVAEDIDDAMCKIGMHFLTQGVYGLDLHPADTMQANIEVQPK